MCVACRVFSARAFLRSPVNHGYRSYLLVERSSTLPDMHHGLYATWVLQRQIDCFAGVRSA